MKKLIVITAFVLLGMLANSAQATLFTGCISPGGDLKNVAEGPEPSKPCGKNDTMTQWEEPEEEPVSLCPCDIESTASWAGWGGPECYESASTVQVILEVRSEVLGGIPLAGVSITDQFVARCRSISQGHIAINDFDMTSAELAACEEEINQLAITLGLNGGCEWK
jgi:hypothetical protein